MLILFKCDSLRYSSVLSLHLSKNTNSGDHKIFMTQTENETLSQA